MISKRCAGCGQVLQSSWISALGRQWHDVCFVCAHCRQPIQTHSFVVNDQHPYHKQCHQIAFGKRCYVCSRYVDGRYFEDAWGSYCSSHHNEVSCFGCGKIIAAEGGVTLYDGRAFCATCDRSAISTAEAAKRHLPGAIGFLGRIGLPIRGDIQIRLIDYQPSGDKSKQLGITKTIVTTTGAHAQVVSRRVDYVGVLSHLPVLQVQETLVHELCHVWAFQRELKLTAIVEEGMAQLCAWLYLKEQPAGKHVEAIIRMIEDHSDPIYGGGFRQARNAWSKAGIKNLIHDLIERGDFH